jgi:phage repressor protein C with HTH and peptisase S24 domain
MYLSLAGINTDRHSWRASATSYWESIAGTRPTSANLSKVAVMTGVRREWLATGRGPMRWGEQDQVSALVLSEFAHDELESRLLLAI